MNFNNFELEGFLLIEDVCKDFKISPITKVVIDIGFSNFIYLFKKLIEDSNKDNKIENNKDYKISSPKVIKEVILNLSEFKKMDREKKISLIKEYKRDNPNLTNRKLGEIFCLHHKTIKSYLNGK